MNELGSLISQNPSSLDFKNSTGADSFIFAPEIQLPFQISQGSKPMPEAGTPLQAMGRQGGAKIDGKWVILQDWSQCSQICGGGRQYLQRMCLPPQNGGVPCDGESLLSRECNTQACPNVVTTERQVAANPTTIKMMPLSDRPLRYEVIIINNNNGIIEKNVLCIH